VNQRITLTTGEGKVDKRVARIVYVWAKRMQDSGRIKEAQALKEAVASVDGEESLKPLFEPYGLFYRGGFSPIKRALMATVVGNPPHVEWPGEFRYFPKQKRA